MTIDQDLQTRIDTQLLEQGAFAPLDLLIDSGRLLQSDYEGWRRQEIDCLDEVLMGNPEKIRLQLESAAAYALGIGLVEEPQAFHTWASDRVDRSELPMRLSADPRLQRLMSCRFVPPQKAPQMDLFFDNPVVALTNGVVRALSTLQRSEAQRQLDRLYAQAPNHADLAAFDRLLAALDHLDQPIADARRELAFLLELTPTAKRRLGSQARDLLAPLWRHLANALVRTPFSVEDPALHRSFALVQAQDWQAARAAIRGESQWWLHAPLCVRLAQCGFYLRNRVEAVTAWFHLCWRAPAQAAELLGDRRQTDHGMATLWQRFVESAEELAARGGEDGPPLTPADFPAWSILHEPGLTQALTDDAPGDTAAEETYRCVQRLIHARRARQADIEMACRKALQSNQPLLLRYLQLSL